MSVLPLTPHHGARLLAEALLRVRFLGNPDQPRDDHGRWTSGGTMASQISGQTPSDTPVKSYTAYHVTRRENVDAILKGNFSLSKVTPRWTNDYAVSLSVGAKAAADYFSRTDPKTMKPVGLNTEKYALLEVKLKGRLHDAGTFGRSPVGNAHSAQDFTRQMIAQGYDGQNLGKILYVHNPKAITSIREVPVPAPKVKTLAFNPDQPRDDHGEWTSGAGPESHFSSHQPEEGYIYHATNLERAHDIASTGVKAHGPSYGTDQSEWPDGSTEKRSYWTAGGGRVAASFAPEEGRAVLLRVPSSKVAAKRESGTGDVVIRKTVPAQHIEILHSDGTWKPLAPKVKALAARAPLTHRISDRFSPQLRRLALDAFGAGRRVLGHLPGTEAEIMQRTSDAILATERALAPVEPLLLATLLAAGDEMQLPSRRLVAAAGGPAVGFRFDRTDPHAVAWAKKHAAALIVGISDTTREEIRALVEDTFSGDLAASDLAERIGDIIDDPDRAETIAGHETLTAAAEGQRAAWGQAADQGYIEPDQDRVWIVTPDDKLCPTCEPMDEQHTTLDGTYETGDGDEVDGPPAHVNCRCVEGLA